jgi:hypothetical protein
MVILTENHNFFIRGARIIRVSITPEEIGERLGRSDVHATFEIHRATDTEEVEADPKSVAFGRHDDGPLVMLNYNKYRAFLPPWEQLVEFTLEGNGKAVFSMPEYKGCAITGDLKTVNIVSPTVKIYG